MNKLKKLWLKNILMLIFATCGMLLLVSCNSKDEYQEGLELYLNFDERDGKVAKDSTKKNKDAYIDYIFNEATYKKSIDPIKKMGVKGRSLSFDGYSNKIIYEDFTAPTDNLTISVWVAPRSWEYPDSNVKGLSAIVNQYNYDSGEGFILGTNNYGRYSFQIGLEKSGWVDVDSGIDTLDLFSWTHLAAVFDSINSEVVLYKNGQRINSVKVSQNDKMLSSTQPLIIGKNIFGGLGGNGCDINLFNGLMDEFRIYGTALGEKDIRGYFNQCLINGKMPECKFEDVWLDANILADDRYRPQFHAAPPQHWMNEAIAPMYYNGKYHMFYQNTPTGPYLRFSHWGHWVSDDMVNWENVKPALYPEANGLDDHHAFSGNAIIDKNGTPYLFYTGVNFATSPLNRISYATPKDKNDPYLLEWVKNEGKPIINQPAHASTIDFRDPYFYTEGNFAYMIVGTGVGNSRNGNPQVVAYRAGLNDLTQWEYMGVMFEKNFKEYKYLSYMWELPVFYKLKAPNGLEKYMLIISPKPDPDIPSVTNDMYYFLGSFDKNTGKFKADHDEPYRLDYGANVAAGPTGFVDPVSGKNILWSIAQDQRPGEEMKYSGWANCASIAKEIGLHNDGTISIKPLSNYNTLKTKELLKVTNKSIDEVNSSLKKVTGDMLYIKVTMENVDASAFGLKLRKSLDNQEETKVYFSSFDSYAYVDTIKSGLGQMVKTEAGGRSDLIDGQITFEIYLDRSLLEVFVNDRMCISARVFPELASSNGIEFFSENGQAKIKYLEISSLDSIYSNKASAYYR